MSTCVAHPGASDEVHSYVAGCATHEDIYHTVPVFDTTFFLKMTHHLHVEYVVKIRVMCNKCALCWSALCDCQSQ